MAFGTVCWLYTYQSIYTCNLCCVKNLTSASTGQSRRSAFASQILRAALGTLHTLRVFRFAGYTGVRPHKETHMRVGWSGWSIDASDEWTVTDHPECLTVEISADSALQLSSAHKKSGNVTLKDLHGIVEERVTIWGNSYPAEFGEFHGIVVHYSEDEIQWSRWFLMNKNIILFVTYNGTEQAKAREIEVVRRLLSTLRVEEA